MFTLKIEHAISNFEIWKSAFGRDPAGRQRSGVSRYRVFRPLDDPNYVLIDLDFNRSAEAEAFLESLRTVWSQVELSPALRRDSGDDNDRPRARIVEQVESNHCS